MPQVTTGCSLDELFIKRPLRTKFNLLRRSTRNLLEAKQAEQKQYHNQRTKLQCLFPGSPVMVRNYQGETRWIPGAVVRKLGPITYSVDVGNVRIVKRHVDQLRQTELSTSPAQTMPESKVSDSYCTTIWLDRILQLHNTGVRKSRHRFQARRTSTALPPTSAPASQ